MTFNLNSIDMSGLFKISRVSKIKILNNLSIKELIEKLRENLPEFNQGTAEVPGIGFTIHKNFKYPNDIKQDDVYNRFSQSLIYVEYILEIYSHIQLKDDDVDSIGENYILTNLAKGYIFIKHPDLLLFKGSGEIYDIVWERFIEAMKNVVRIQKNIEFDSEFLLKLLERRKLNQETLENDFFIGMLWELSLIGRKRTERTGIQIKYPPYIFESDIILISILRFNYPEKCLIDFRIRDIYCTLALFQNGTINIRQQKGKFKVYDNIERALYGCYAIYRLVQYYEIWENLNITQRLITTDFINSVIDDLEDRGLPGFNIGIEFLRHYAKIRGEL